MPHQFDSDLVKLLTVFMASGKLEAARVLPVLNSLTEADSAAPSIAALQGALAEHDGDEFRELVQHIHESREFDAVDLYKRRRTSDVDLAEYQLTLGDLPLDAPAGWRDRKRLFTAVKELLSIVRDRRFIAAKSDVAPKAAAHVNESYDAAVATAVRLSQSWNSQMPIRLVQELYATTIDTDLATDLQKVADQVQQTADQQTSANIEVAENALDETLESLDGDLALLVLKERYLKSTSREQKQKLLDRLCSWGDPAVVLLLRELIQEPWEQERAALILTCRFGGRPIRGWEGWTNWLLHCERQLERRQEQLSALARENPGEMFLVWYSHQPNADSSILDRLERWCTDNAKPVDPERFVERWSHAIPAAEWNALIGVEFEIIERPQPIEVATEKPIEEPDLEAVQSDEQAASIPWDEHQTKALTTRTVDDGPIDPIGPSLWKDHIQPFFSEHWYMFAGVVMVIAGSSVLAYYTWETHWLVRYTIAPILLGLFTAALAWTGSWIERRDQEFVGTAAILRGAAVGLLPINFMAVALLSDDPSADLAQYKTLAVVVMSTIYLSVFGYGLKSWCRSLHQPLEWLLGGTLLLVNSLVMLAPLGRTVSLGETKLLTVVGIGFHLGFLVMAIVVLHFTRHVMTRELAEQKRIPWFFGATLIATFLQVFAWAHGYLKHLPHVFTYAPMIILTGGLILMVERRALELREQSERHDEESFVGFATILLGVLMGATDPYVRIIAFLCAGIVWLYQATFRRQVLHEWIGLTFVVLSFASIGLLDGFRELCEQRFPGTGLAFGFPALGLAIALSLAVGNRLAIRFGQQRLATTCIGMQVSVLMLTTVVAMLAQWKFQSPPLTTGGCLMVIVGMLVWRAFRDDQLRWIHTAMAILALDLMYLGCVDMQGRTLEGNTMVFGLSVLSTIWLILNWCTSTRLIREARSTVLWVYGALAVAGMLLRVVIESPAIDASRFRIIVEYCGPLMMTVILAFATWYSRSLVPAVMAAIIAIILFPELKANFQDAFNNLGWGTGLGSACSALGLVVLCFPLQRVQILKNLNEGDRFMGKVLFPIRRHDHTLFTWPILASAMFLVVKTDTWTFARNCFLLDGVGLKTAFALGATAVTWTLLSVYRRTAPRAEHGTYLGCLFLLAAVWFGFKNLVESTHWSWPLLTTGIALQIAYLAYVNFVRTDWCERILAQPTRQVLEASTVLLVGVCSWKLLTGEPLRDVGLLSAFVAVQLVWHALSTRNVLHGFLLFSFGWLSLLVATTSGAGHLLPRLSAEQNLIPTLWMLLAIHGAHVLFEFRPKFEQQLKPLAQPSLNLGSILSLGIVGYVLIATVFRGSVTATQLAMAVAATLLTARAHRCVAIALPTILASYLLLQHTELSRVVGGSYGKVVDRLEILSEPWRLSALALFSAIIGHCGQLVFQRQPKLLAGPFGIPALRAPQGGLVWIFAPAVVFATISEFIHTVDPAYRMAKLQLFAPFVGAIAIAVIAWSWRQKYLHAIAITLQTLGNTHFVHVFWGARLLAEEISMIQIVCLGAAASLLQLTIIKYAAKRESISVLINHASLGLAGLVLVLLAANYAVHPTLSEIPSLRFVISGSMAYLAGLYFRRAARFPDAGEVQHRNLCEGLYHFGVTLAIWCAILLIPQLRQPELALFALGLPIAFFYIRAESGMRTVAQTARRYRDSASVLAFAILACYVFRIAFQMVLYPGEPMQADYYHYNAPLIVILSVVMLRLHGLGGTGWLALYGGLALMLGTFFSLTWLARLSPFEYPIASAWCAVGLSHFWTLVSNQRSPLRTAIQRLAVIDGQQWFELRRSWGMCLLIATQMVVLYGLADWQTNSKMVAPLLVGAASILIHQGAIRRSPMYFAIAGIQIFLALHADFAVPSYLPKDDVVWAILGIWLAILIVHQFVSRRIEIGGMGIVAAIMSLITLVHIVYHQPSSRVGLWAFTCAAVLAALTPRRNRTPRTGEETTAAAMLLAVPTWLAYFSQVNLPEGGLRAAFEFWPVLIATTFIFLTGSAIRGFQIRLFPTYDRLDRSSPRLFDQTLSWIGRQGALLNSCTLWATFAVAAVAQILHHRTAFETRELVLILTLYAGLTVGWFYEGRFRRSMSAYVILQLSVLGFFTVIRQQLDLKYAAWNDHYDVWASLVVSFALTGTKQVFDLQEREVRIPLLGTLFALPVIALIWVVWNGMGTNVALLVVGLHSLMFTFMGKDDRESPYNIVAVAGFVAFVLLAFWDKWNPQFVHAYTIPVGIGVLILLQMFRRRIAPDARNRIRLVTLLVMLGSTGYHALIDNATSISFNLTLILLCLTSMALGSFLRIRLYLALGFAALMTDIISILYQVLIRMEHSKQMTAVGSLVLLIGVSLVFGAIYFKTHRDRINDTIDRWRLKVGEWE